MKALCDRLAEACRRVREADEAGRLGELYHLLDEVYIVLDLLDGAALRGVPALGSVSGGGAHGAQADRRIVSGL